MQIREGGVSAIHINGRGLHHLSEFVGGRVYSQERLLDFNSAMRNSSFNEIPPASSCSHRPQPGAATRADKEPATLVERVPAQSSLTEKQHLDRGSYHCIACESTHSTALELHVHIRRFHRVMRPFRCFTCRKTFGHHVHLEQHRHVHSQMKILTEDQSDQTPTEAPPEQFQAL